MGIAPEDLPRIKEKFFRANHIKRGSGIGLAVADEIMMLHGGSLNVSSVQGEGTTVTILLPPKKMAVTPQIG
jgi:signal transduction histidine kinase